MSASQALAGTIKALASARTRQQVLDSRKGHGVCCESYANQQGCDCLKEAEAYEAACNDAPIPPGCYKEGSRGKPRSTFHDAEAAVRQLLLWIGEDPDRSGLVDTPGRVIKALAEMTQGYLSDPAQILGKVFEDSYDEVVIVRGIEFTSICEHHLLLFSGKVDVGYIPGKVVGLSKIPRLVDCFSRRLQMQERMTRQIAEAIEKHLEAKGVAVVIRGSHSCMGCRGVRKPEAEMITSCMLGMFRDKPEARAEFLSLLSR